MCIRHGIDCIEESWLEVVIEKVGAGGSFLAQRSTSQAQRGGEWHLPSPGFQGTYEAWQQTQTDILAEARNKAEEALTKHQPLPLEDEVVRGLERLEERL